MSLISLADFHGPFCAVAGPPASDTNPFGHPAHGQWTSAAAKLHHVKHHLDPPRPANIGLNFLALTPLPERRESQPPHPGNDGFLPAWELGHLR